VELNSAPAPSSIVMPGLDPGIRAEAERSANISVYFSNYVTIFIFFNYLHYLYIGHYIGHTYALRSAIISAIFLFY